MTADDELLKMIRNAVLSGLYADEELKQGFLSKVRRERGEGAVAEWSKKIDGLLMSPPADTVDRGEESVNVRIASAFEALKALHIVALECAGFTLSDGWEAIAERMADDPAAVGGVFYTEQDMWGCIDGQPLWLAFGVTPVARARTAAGDESIGHVVVEVLREHGVACDWDGTPDRRIRIPPFQWTKRYEK